MSNIVNFPNIKAQRETQKSIDENVARVREQIIPELQATLEEYTGAAQQGVQCAIEVLQGFLTISPHMLPLVVLEAYQHEVYFSVLSRHGLQQGKSPHRYFLKLSVTECSDATPETFSMSQPDTLCNQVHAEYGWRLGMPMIQPIGYLWSYLHMHDWLFAHHEVDPVNMTITHYWRREGYQITTVLNHNHLETTIREWDDDDT